MQKNIIQVVGLFIILFICLIISKELILLTEELLLIMIFFLFFIVLWKLLSNLMSSSFKENISLLKGDFANYLIQKKETLNMLFLEKVIILMYPTFLVNFFLFYFVGLILKNFNLLIKKNINILNLNSTSYLLDCNFLEKGFNYNLILWFFEKNYYYFLLFNMVNKKEMINLKLSLPTLFSIKEVVKMQKVLPLLNNQGLLNRIFENLINVQLAFFIYFPVFPIYSCIPPSVKTKVRNVSETVGNHLINHSDFYMVGVYGFCIGLGLAGISILVDEYILKK